MDNHLNIKYFNIYEKKNWNSEVWTQHNQLYWANSSLSSNFAEYGGLGTKP